MVRVRFCVLSSARIATSPLASPGGVVSPGLSHHQVCQAFQALAGQPRRRFGLYPRFIRVAGLSRRHSSLLLPPSVSSHVVSAFARVVASPFRSSPPAFGLFSCRIGIRTRSRPQPLSPSRLHAHRRVSSRIAGQCVSPSRSHHQVC